METQSLECRYFQTAMIICVSNNCAFHITQRVQSLLLIV